MTGRFIEIGQIVAPHGVKGEVKINPSCRPADMHTYVPFYDKDGHVVELTLKSIIKNQVIGTIDSVRDRNAAELLRGMKLFILRDTLPTLKTNEYYVCDLIDATVWQNDNERGRVTDVQNYGAGDILQIKTTDGKDLLLSMNPNTILNVDLQAGRIDVNIPEEVEADDEN